MPMLTAASTIVSLTLLPPVDTVGRFPGQVALPGHCCRQVVLSGSGPRWVDGRMAKLWMRPVGLGAQFSLLEKRKPMTGSSQMQSASVICAAALNATMGAEQTQTVIRESPTITHLPGKEKSPQLDDNGPDLPPNDGGGGGGGNWSGGFAFFGFLLFLSFLKDKGSEGSYRDNRRR